MRVIHWDGKTYAMRGNRSDKRLAIAISSKTEAKMLDVMEVQNGCAEICADSVYNTVNNWQLSKQIVGMSFDTENVNSGKVGGAASILERKMKKNLLYLPCRHHIHEIVLSVVFKITLEANVSSNGPKIPLFEHFSQEYYSNNTLTYRGCTGDEYFNVLSNHEKEDLIKFCEQTLKVKHSRNDYKELLELTIVLLSPSITKYHIQAPGAYNWARYMCRLIYCLKIYLYREHLPLEPNEILGLKMLILFFFEGLLKILVQCNRFHKIA
jgi:hypothetical protein